MTELRSTLSYLENPDGRRVLSDLLIESGRVLSPPLIATNDHEALRQIWDFCSDQCLLALTSGYLRTYVWPHWRRTRPTDTRLSEAIDSLAQSGPIATERQNVIDWLAIWSTLEASIGPFMTEVTECAEGLTYCLHEAAAAAAVQTLAFQSGNTERRAHLRSILGHSIDHVLQSPVPPLGP